MAESSTSKDEMAYARAARLYCSPAEELANSVTSAIGLLLAIAGLPALFGHACGVNGTCGSSSAGVFGATLVSLYLASTLYHAVQTPRLKNLFRMMDHSCIYLVIAGTYTPFALEGLRGAWSIGLFTAIWAFALFGIMAEIFFFERYRKVSLAMYLCMGWSGVVAVRPFIESLPSAGLVWILAGAASYSVGVVFYRWRKLPYNHALWHLFVMGGSACHYIAVLNYGSGVAA